MLSFQGSIEVDSVISETVLCSILINLEAMTWPSYNENCIILRHIIMRLKCTSYMCCNSWTRSAEQLQDHKMFVSRCLVDYKSAMPTWSSI